MAKSRLVKGPGIPRAVKSCNWDLRLINAAANNKMKFRDFMESRFWDGQEAWKQLDKSKQIPESMMDDELLANFKLVEARARELLAEVTRRKLSLEPVAEQVVVQAPVEPEQSNK